MNKRKTSKRRFLISTFFIVIFMNLFSLPEVLAIRTIDITGKSISHPKNKKLNVLIFNDSGKNKYFKSKVVLKTAAEYCKKVCCENLGLNLDITEYIIKFFSDTPVIPLNYMDNMNALTAIYPQETDKIRDAYRMCGKYYIYCDFVERRIHIPLSENQAFDVRNIATKKMAEILGLSDLIVNSEIVTIKNGDDEKVGVLMDEAEGISFPEFASNEPMKISPFFQKEINDLQILDTIIMQMDRHILNYNIKVSENNVAIGVVGYDNDCSFNLNTDLTKSLGCVPALINKNGKIDIPYMSKSLANKILSTDEQIIRETLFGILDDKYIEATINRFLQIKNAIKSTLVERPNFVLEGDEWNEATIVNEITYNNAIPKDKFKNDDRIFHHEPTYFGAFIEEIKEKQCIIYEGK